MNVAFIKLDKLTLISELGLKNLEAYKQQKIYSLVINILETKILDFILSNLDDLQKITFLKLVAGKKDNQAAKLAQKNIKNLDKKINSLVTSVKKDLAKEIKAAQAE